MERIPPLRFFLVMSNKCHLKTNLGSLLHAENILQSFIQYFDVDFSLQDLSRIWIKRLILKYVSLIILLKALFMGKAEPPGRGKEILGWNILWHYERPWIITTKQSQSITPYFTVEYQVLLLVCSSLLWPDMMILCMTRIRVWSHDQNTKCQL